MKSGTADIKFKESLREKISKGSKAELGEMLEASEPFAIAEAMLNFTLSEKVALFGIMSGEQAAEVFERLDYSHMETLIAVLGLDYLKQIIPFMEPDDAADIVGMMEESQAEALLAKLHPEEREAISYLLAYPEDTAGRLMDPDVVRVLPNQSVGKAIKEIRAYVEKVRLDDFFSIFVVSEKDVLQGSVPNWKMLLAGKDQLVSEIMITNVISVGANMDQEEISHLFRDHDLVVVPVVDAEKRLIGRITVDDIVDVIEEEHQEDLGHLAGTGSEVVHQPSIYQIIRLRAPWLLVALVGEFILAGFMRYQEGFIITMPQLAFFIPLIMAMGGNAGIQTSSLVIRGLATGEVRLYHFWKRLFREILVAVNIGIFFGLILIAGGAILTGEIKLGLAVGLATMTSIILATSMGTIIPMLLKFFDFDPALASGPFITTINDISGIIVYLGIAYLILI